MEPDRPLYSPETWRYLPKILSDLLARGRIRICVYENVDNGDLRCFGVTSFVRPGFLDAALKRGVGLAEAALLAESNRPPAFLNHKQVAEGNRTETLCALTFFGVPPITTVNDPAARETLASIMDGWTFFHRGFALAEIWFEPVAQSLVESMAHTGMCLLRERSLEVGVTGRVFRLTRSDAADLMPNWPAWVMFPPRPRFGFTRLEQQLLELALLDYSDREVAVEMSVSIDAIKKRWRSIYSRVSHIQPSLCRSDLNGADRRRHLLHALRNQLQEIRPY